MKNPCQTSVVFALVIGITPLATPMDGSGSPGANGGDVRAEFVDPTHADVASIVRTGEAAIQWLGARLVREVHTAIVQGTVESAVAICHLKSVGRGSGDVLPGMPSIKAIKHTSLRLLNPANAPDVAEQRVLARIDQELRSDQSPATTMVQRITHASGAVEWRVYRPLVALASCLSCHGDPAVQSPELRSLLRHGRPENPANGYALGEWRGLLRVTVDPAGR